MKIDEAIIDKKKMVDEWEQELFLTPKSDTTHINNCTSIISEYKKEIGWLEELKELRELKETYRKGMETSYSTFMYKKAIDDFEYACVQLIKKEQDTRYGYLDGMDIREIAKQLKGGVSNDN